MSSILLPSDGGSAKNAGLTTLSTPLSALFLAARNKIRPHHPWVDAAKRSMIEVILSRRDLSHRSDIDRKLFLPIHTQNTVHLCLVVRDRT